MSNRDQPPRILIVDDDKAFSRTLHILLECQGYMVETALSAAAGMDRTTAIAPVVTLIDLHLPDGNGLQLLQEMRQINPEGKFILMSGDSEIKNMLGQPCCHGIDILEKPFEIDDIINRVAAKTTLA